MFGCVFYLHIHQHNRVKLDLGAIKCVLVRYSPTQKGYKRYHPPTEKLYVSANVTFAKYEPYFTQPYRKTIVADKDKKLFLLGLTLPSPSPISPHLSQTPENKLDSPPNPENRLDNDLEPTTRKNETSYMIQCFLRYTQERRILHLNQNKSEQQTLEILIIFHLLILIYSLQCRNETRNKLENRFIHSQILSFGKCSLSHKNSEMNKSAYCLFLLHYLRYYHVK